MSVRQRKKPKIYRVSVLGTKSSGKTCLLSALSLDHGVNPLGYTATYVPYDGASETPKTIKPVNHEDLALWSQGDQWLKKSRDALRQHDVPVPTETYKTCYLFYEFSTPDRQVYKVELMDYSGEFIDAERLIQAEDYTQKLRGLLTRREGLAIIQHVPSPEGNVQQMIQDMKRLEEAFTLLRGDMRGEHSQLNCPVALIINKWDRLRDYQHFDHTRADQEVEEFLQEYPSYRSLGNSIRNSVSEENFRIFPVSAFGAAEFHTKEDGTRIERCATQEPLHSFGLEDPFVWLARRRDELDVKSVQQEATRYHWYMPNPFPLWKVWRRAKNLSRQFPDTSPHVSSLAPILKSVKKRLLHRSATLGFLIIFTLFSLIAITDYKKYNTLKNEAASGISLEQEKALIRWLNQYVSNPWPWHYLSMLTFLSKAKAGQLLKDMHEAYDRRLWGIVEKINDLLEKYKPAKEYLEMLPGGKHVDDAKAIIVQVDQIMLQKKHDDTLTVLEKKAQNAITEEEVKKVMQETQELAQSSNLVTEESRIRRQKLMESLQGKLARITLLANRKTFRESYQQLLTDDQIPRAAQMLLDYYRQDSDPEIELLMKAFPDSVLARIQSKIEQWVTQREFEKCYGFLRECKDIPAPLCLDHYMKGLQDLERDVTRQHDQYLYDLVITQRTAAVCERYLTDSKLLAMRQDVEKYKNYLQQKESELDLTLVLGNISWGSSGDALSAGDCTVSVWVKGKKVIEKTNVYARANTDSGYIGKGSIHAKLDESIEMSIEIIEIDFYFNDTLGKKSQTIKVFQLAQGYTITLDESQSRVRLYLEGIPVEPDLQKWSQ